MDPPSAASAAGRRERKKLRTRDALRQAAVRLFEERGFEQTTVEDITEAADVAPRTFFLHFATKEDVLLGQPDERLSHIQRALAEQPATDDPLDVLRRALRQVPAHIGERNLRLLGDRLGGLLPGPRAGRTEYFLQVERAIAEHVGRMTGRDPRTDLYPGLVAAVALAAMRVAIMTWLQAGGTRPLESVIDEAFDHLTGTTAGPSGRGG
jgi:AcrR family transcriptional regulator